MVILDRAYAIKIAAYTIHEKPQQSEPSKHKKHGDKSPVLALVADAEEAVEQHEKTLIILATLAIAGFTGTLWRATKGLFAMAETQGKDMRRSLKIAERSAQAMERVAGVTRENAVLMGDMLQRQSRAYLHINLGGVAQTPNTVFQGIAEIYNAGLTPARNVAWEIASQIFDHPAPDNFQFPDPQRVIQTNMSISPRQPFTINSDPLPRLPDAEAELVFRGLTRRLHVWGKVRYEDVYGEHHEAEFAYNLYFWLDQGKIHSGGYFHATHNQAN